jgi:acyl carrier protein
MMHHNDAALRDQVKEMIVACARLKIAPSALGDDQLLFDKVGGIGLDSIDVLELVVNLEKTFGVKIEDWDTGRRVLQSTSSIVEYIKKTKDQR